MQNRFLAPVLCLILSVCSAGLSAQETADPRAIVKSALDHWRGTSSYSEMTMTIHRPDWERSMSMRAWTRGEDYSLVRVTAPAKDAGSGTLLLDKEMWTYAPKINRVIKVPSSMMGQSWMGSDFSNKDIARADDIVDQYTHKLLKTEQVEGHTVYHIEATPKENAPVVWGREVLQIRDDYVMLREDFYDQDNELVKSMVTNAIETMDGRPVARVQRMTNVDEPDKWTQVELKEVDFGVDLPDRLFTLSNLRNPRQ